MPKLKLTASSIARLPAPDPSGKQVLYWDTEQRGFGVLVSGKTNTKSYVVQREVNGKTRRVTLGTVVEFEAAGKSLEDARQAAAELVLNMRKGIDPKASRGPKANITLREILERYLTTQPLSPNSKKLYRHHVETHLKDWLDRPLREITSEMVLNRLRKIKDSTARKGAHSFYASQPGAATANASMKTLRTLWNYAKDVEGVPDLPPNPVKLPRGQWYSVPEREDFISGDQLPAFYRSVCGIQNLTIRDYILLVLFTGLRREEAAGLRWADLDFAQRIIRLPARRTKGKRRLDLPMSDFVRELLVQRRAIGFENEFVFPSNSRTPSSSGHLHNPKEALRSACKEHGVERVSIHGLRRTFVTVASGCHISEQEYKALVNHALGGSVTDRYNRTMTVDLADAMQIVADRLKALCEVPELPAGVTQLNR
jgi:integrase